jgi:hypothetical protein
LSRPWRHPVKIADALAGTLQRLGLEGQVRQHEIWRVWTTVVGPQIARHAEPHSFRNGRLIVHVTDSVWLHHLSMMRHRLAAALNERLKPAEVREVVLRIGEVSPRTGPVPPAPTPSEVMSEHDPERIAEIERALAPLGDTPFLDALRRLWLRAARESKTSSDGLRQRQPR